MVIEFTHCCTDNPGQPLPQQDTGNDANEGADNPQYQGFSKDHEIELTGLHSQRAQSSHEVAPLYDGKAHGVINQENTHQQSQQAHRREVQFKSCGEAEYPPVLLIDIDQLQGGRESRGDPVRCLLIEDQIDIRDFTRHSRNGLRRCNICHQQIAAGGSLLCADSHYLKSVFSAAVSHLEAICRLEMQLFGGCRAEDDCIGTGEPFAERGPADEGPAQGIAEYPFSKKVQADEPKSLRDTIDAHLQGDHRGHGRMPRRGVQVRINRLPQRAGPGSDAVRCRAAQLLCREREGCLGRAIGKIHGKHHCNTHGDAR